MSSFFIRVIMETSSISSSRVKCRFLALRKSISRRRKRKRRRKVKVWSRRFNPSWVTQFKRVIWVLTITNMLDPSASAQPMWRTLKGILCLHLIPKILILMAWISSTREVVQQRMLLLSKRVQEKQLIQNYLKIIRNHSCQAKDKRLSLLKEKTL